MFQYEEGIEDSEPFCILTFIMFAVMNTKIEKSGLINSFKPTVTIAFTLILNELTIIFPYRQFNIIYFIKIIAPTV